MTPTATLRLLDARSQGHRIAWRDLLPADAAEAYAVQDATLLRLGPVGGWKVGAASPDGQVHCAPLPASGVLANGANLVGEAWRARGLEVEVAVRVGRDFDPQARGLSRDALAAHFDAVLPAIEVVESRLEGWPQADPLVQLADLQSHGALVLGMPCDLGPQALDLSATHAMLWVDGECVVDRTGGHLSPDLWRLVGWLADHCADRGQPLRAGQVVTTGSCTGLHCVAAGARVEGRIEGLGSVSLQF